MKNKAFQLLAFSSWTDFIFIFYRLTLRNNRGGVCDIYRRWRAHIEKRQHLLCQADPISPLWHRARFIHKTASNWRRTSSIERCWWKQGNIVSFAFNLVETLRHWYLRWLFCMNTLFCFSKWFAQLALFSAILLSSLFSITNSRPDIDLISYHPGWLKLSNTNCMNDGGSDITRSACTVPWKRTHILLKIFYILLLCSKCQYNYRY